MELTIEKLIGQFERGKMTRRQLALSISALVTAAQSASAAPDMKAVTLNHVTLKVDNVQWSSKFYQDVFGMPLKQHSDKKHILGVGKSFLGIEQKPNAPAMDHFDLGIANFKDDEVVAKLKARNLSWRRVGRRNLSNFGIPMASWFS